MTGDWAGQLGQQSTWSLWTVGLLVEAQVLRRKIELGQARPAACLRTRTPVTGGQRTTRPTQASPWQLVGPSPLLTSGDKQWAPMEGVASLNLADHLRYSRILKAGCSRTVTHRESVVRRPRSTAGAWPVDDRGHRLSQAADGWDWGVRGGGPAACPSSCPLAAAPSSQAFLRVAGRGEGDALGVQEVQQLPRGHVDALLLQLSLQLRLGLDGLVQQDLAVEGRLGADIAPHGLCGHSWTAAVRC